MLLHGAQTLQDPENLSFHLILLPRYLSKIPKLKAKPFAQVRKSLTEHHALSIKASGQFRFAQHLTLPEPNQGTPQHPVNTKVIEGRFKGDKHTP